MQLLGLPVPETWTVLAVTSGPDCLYAIASGIDPQTGSVGPFHGRTFGRSGIVWELAKEGLEFSDGEAVLWGVRGGRWIELDPVSGEPKGLA